MRPDDLPALVVLWTDPEVTRYMGGPREPLVLTAALTEDLDPGAPTYNLWPVEEKSTGTLVGHCGILDKEVDGRPEFEVVYVLARTYRGHGFATEAALALKAHAFGKLGLTRVVALIDPQNTASAAVAERAGMQWERDVARPGGRVLGLYAASAPL
jgi:ribosomal-protein-alanine N-acetyltransferase